jgi:hypothetical protein
MIRWIQDQLLSMLQKRCKHPDQMVGVDILEGCGDYEIAYCNRCGSVSTALVKAEHQITKLRKHGHGASQCC